MKGIRNNYKVELLVTFVTLNLKRGDNATTK